MKNNKQKKDVILDKEIDNLIEETSRWVDPKPIKKVYRKNVVNYDPEFFKNFEITIENEIYYFSPWDENQKFFLNEHINNLKKLILKYSKKTKDNNKKSLRFPYKEFKSEILSILKMFFNYSNLKLDFDLENKLKQLHKEEFKKEIGKKIKLERKITSKKLLEDKKMMNTLKNLIDNWSKPKSKEQLKLILLKQKEKELKMINEKIIKNILNKFFPYLDHNISTNNKKTIIKQIESFVRTIENSISQIV